MRALPPPLAELEARLGVDEGELEGPDRVRAEKALDDATTLVLAEIPLAKVAAWTADAPAVAELVVLTAARRGYENPRGLASETLGEHAIGLVDTSGVYLTTRETAQVRRAARGRSGGFVGTVRTPTAYGTEDSSDTVGPAARLAVLSEPSDQAPP